MDFTEMRRAKGKPLAVDFGGEKLNIVYLPILVTPARLREINDAQEAAAKSNEGGEGESLASTLTYIDEMKSQVLEQVTQWDATDSGVPVCLTSDGLEAVDVSVLSAVLAAIRAAQEVSPGEGLTSPSA